MIAGSVVVWSSFDREELRHHYELWESVKSPGKEVFVAVHVDPTKQPSIVVWASSDRATWAGENSQLLTWQQFEAMRKINP